MSTLDLVVKAIEIIGAPRRGASYLAIQKWISSSRGNVTINRLKADLKKAIEKGLKSGILKRPTISKNVTGLRGYFILNKDVIALNKMKDKMKQDEVEIAEKLEEKAQVTKVEETKTVNVKKTKAAAIKKTKAAAIKKTKAAAIKKTEAAAVKKTKAAAVKKTKAAAIQAPDSAPAQGLDTDEMEWRFKLFLLMCAMEMAKSNDSGQGSSSNED
ncbi:hypothetical protein JTE90_000046 [Oedothorax gibbosus]|uniref:H15 domain-containing protein n=1 Tax=Oedothorax gibbosus TaxID=931172 RepID=A0AAV6UC47_9ARAC|nr:hypothetical protein JTE90_000046 [Oedothorax gibbosus]